MAERFSTQALRQHGARRLTVIANDTYVNTFQEDTGIEMFLDAANVALEDKNLGSGALNVEEYFVAKSFFSRAGISDNSAVTMALIALDTAKITNNTVMKVLEPFREDENMIFKFETYAMANLFRPSSSQHTYLVEKNNGKSLRNRNIRA